MELKRRPDIERFLSAPDRRFRAALIHGRDLGGVRERAMTLARAITDRPEDPFDVALLTESDILAQEGRLIDELLAVSMMGGRRMVRLRLSGEKIAAERLATEALTAHAAGELNPDAFLIIEAADLERSSGLRKTAEAAETIASIACWEDEPGDVARLARESLAADGLSLTSDALERFVARLPRERGVARREIERLTMFLGPGRRTPAALDELEDFFGVEPEASLNDAAMDAFGGRPAAAHAGLRRAAQEGDGGVSAVRAMGSHLTRLRQIAVLQSGGATIQSAVKAARVFWKSEREFIRQAGVWNLSRLDQAQALILAADHACRQAGAPDRLLAERLALDIALRARRLGL